MPAMHYVKRATSAAVALTLLFSVSCYLYFSHAATPSGEAAIDMLDRIDLGERERGEIIVSEFEVWNRGSRDLFIDDQRSTCACSVLLVKQGNDYVREEAIVVPPNKSRRVYARLSVNAPAGQGMRTIIDIRTNDPIQPRKHLEILVPRIKGGAYTQPESIAFGTVQRGTKVIRVVEVRDSEDNRRKLVNVTVSDSKRITARVVSLNEKPKLFAEDKRSDKLIGLIEVSIDTTSPGSVDEKLLLQFDTTTYSCNTMEIHGVVQDTLYCKPSFVMLPRSSSQGPIYELPIDIYSIGDVRFKIIGMKCPPDVTASELNNSEPSGNQSRTLVVRLRASGSPRHEDVNLIVECVRDGSPDVISVTIPLRLREKTLK